MQDNTFDAAIRNQLVLPPLSRYQHLTPEEQEIFKSAVYAIKIHQLTMLYTDLYSSFENLVYEEDWGNVEKYFDLITLAGLTGDNLQEIFSVNLALKQEDKSLRAAIEQLNVGDKDTTYSMVYSFRHQYFLDKHQPVKENAKAFTLKVSECKLRMGHSNISMYLTGSKFVPCTEAQKQVLEKVYPKQELTDSKIFRRDAHIEIALTVKEIQILITSIIHVLKATKELPDRSKPLPITLHSLEEDLRLDAYKQRTAFNLIMDNNLAELINLISKNSISVNSRDLHSGMTLLAYAVKLQRLDIVKWLLDNNGFSPLSDHKRYTVLHYAAEGTNKELFNLILAKSLTLINQGDEGGYTPLYIACEQGRTEFVNALLKAGANPNTQNNRFRNTCLHIAMRFGQVETVKALLNSGRCFLLLPNKDKIIASSPTLALRNEQALIQLIADFKKQNPSAFIPAAPQNPAQAKAPVTSAPNTQSMSLESLYALLKEPRKNRSVLNDIGPKIKTPFFGNLFTLEKAKPQGIGMNCLPELLEAEGSLWKSKNEKLQEISKELMNLSKGKKTFAETYAAVLRLFEEHMAERLSVSIFGICLVQNNLLEHWINLYDKKTLMQVAIDGDELNVITDIIKRMPKRDTEKVLYKGKEITELEYAIKRGRTIAVDHMLTLKEQIPDVELGPCEDAKQRAENHRGKSEASSAAFKEAEYFYDINPKLDSEKNIIQLLRNLANNCPNKDNAINGLFTPEEYKVVTTLLSDKKKELPAEKQSQRLTLKRERLALRLRKLANLLETSKQAESEPTYFSLINVPDAIDKLHKSKAALEQKQKSRLENLPDPDAPKIKNIIKHATNNANEIITAGELSTVQEAINNGRIRVSSTPEGTRANSFFCLGNLTYLTPLRGKANHVVKVDVAAAVQHKLLAHMDMYTSPHIPAFSISRVETPIIFIGDDPTKKTIYRVFHDSKNNQKTHCYDYYENNRFLYSHKEITTIEGEFYVGDNIKMTAYRLIRHLRNTKGPFDSGSYYHYVLKNFHNPQVIDSAKAAFFNVLNVEQKITKAIPLNPRVVTIEENPKANNYEILPEKVVTELTNLITDHELFLKKAQDYKVHKEQLLFAVIAAIYRPDSLVLKKLLQEGVPVNFKNNRPLREVLTQLTHSYQETRKLDSPEVIAYAQMLEDLMLAGSADENDPLHIFHANAADSLGAPSADSWASNKAQDLDILYNFISKNETNKDVIRLLINCVHKYLPDLYHFTGISCMDDLHTEIADRLHLKPMTALYHDKTELVDNNNIDGLRLAINEMHFPDTESKSALLLFLFNHTVKTNNKRMARHLYSLIGTLQLSYPYSPMYIALKLQKPDISQLLLELGSDIPCQITFGEIPITLAEKYNDDYVLETYVKSIKSFQDETFERHIRAHNNLTLAKLLNRFMPPPHSSSEKYITACIRSSNIAALKLLYIAVFKEHPKKHKDFLKRTISSAINSNPAVIPSLLELIQELGLISAFLPSKANQALWKTILKSCINPEGLRQCLQAFRTSIKRTKQLSAICTQDSNLLHLAVELGEQDILKVIIELFPEAKLTMGEGLIKGYYSLAFNTNCSRGYLELVAPKLPAPETIEDRFHLLGVLLSCSGDNLTKDGIIWLFERGWLEIDYISADGKNFLQAFVAYCLRPNVNLDKAQPAAAKILCEYLHEKRFNFQHNDPEGKSLLLYDPESKVAFAQAVKEYIITKTTIELNAKDKYGCVLHCKLKSDILLIAIEKYLQSGNDINAENCFGHTITEAQLLHGASHEVITGLRSKGGKARACLLSHHLNFGIATVRRNNELYIALDPSTGSALTSIIRSRVVASKDYLPEHPFNIDLDVGFTTTTVKLPTFGTFSRIGNVCFEWQKIADLLGSPRENALREDQQLQKIIFPYLATTYEPNRDELPSELTERVFPLLLSLAKKFKSVYEDIINGKMPTITAQEVADLFKSAKIQYWIGVLEGDKYIQLAMTSPIQAAIISKQNHILKKLLKEDHCDRNEPNLEDLRLAAQVDNYEGYTIMFEHYRLKPGSFYSLLMKLLDFQAAPLRSVVSLPSGHKYLEYLIDKICVTNSHKAIKEKLVTHLSSLIKQKDVTVNRMNAEAGEKLSKLIAKLQTSIKESKEEAENKVTKQRAKKETASEAKPPKKPRKSDHDESEQKLEDSSSNGSDAPTKTPEKQLSPVVESVKKEKQDSTSGFKVVLSRKRQSTDETKEPSTPRGIAGSDPVPAATGKSGTSALVGAGFFSNKAARKEEPAADKPNQESKRKECDQDKSEQYQHKREAVEDKSAPLTIPIRLRRGPT